MGEKIAKTKTKERNKNRNKKEKKKEKKEVKKEVRNRETESEGKNIGHVGKVHEHEHGKYIVGLMKTIGIRVGDAHTR